MKRKWVPVSFNYLQCDEMADWLGKMAGRGWNFRRFCFGFLFDACEPEEQVYDVQVFLKNTENDLAVGLNKALKDAGLYKVGTLLDNRLESLEYLGNGLNELGLAGVALLHGLKNGQHIFVFHWDKPPVYKITNPHFNTLKRDCQEFYYIK